MSVKIKIKVSDKLLKKYTYVVHNTLDINLNLQKYITCQKLTVGRGCIPNDTLYRSKENIQGI